MLLFVFFILFDLLGFGTSVARREVMGGSGDDEGGGGEEAR